MSTICLSMIVKNEAAVIERCLVSARPFINTWCIVDTGSTDNTKELVLKALEGISGEFHERPWRDFGSNRTEALELARGKADYLFVIDADDVLEPEAGFVLPELTKEAYELRVKLGERSHYRMHFFRDGLGFRYEGVLHEFATCGKPFMPGRIDGLLYDCVGGGGRSKVSTKEKYRNDAKVLERALKKEPNNARYMHYLAQSYKDAGDAAKAIIYYERSARMHTVTNGFYEEAVVSLLEIARLKQQIQAPEHEVVAAYTRAFERCPNRIEPLYELAVYFRKKGRHGAAYLYAKACLGVPKPTDAIYVNDAVYEWGAADEFASNALMIDEIKNAVVCWRGLLSSPKLPAEERPRVEKNLQSCMTNLMQRPG